MTIVDHNAALPPSYLPTADQVTVLVNGTPLRVVRYSHFDVPIYFVHASLPNGQDHEVAVTVKRYQNNYRLHPQRLGIVLSPRQLKQPVRFTVRGQPHLVFESDGLGYLLLAFDPLHPVPTGPGVVHASALGVHPDASQVQTKALQAAFDNPAVRTLVLPVGIYRSGDLRLRSGLQLYLASGAVLKASDNPADLGDPSLEGWHRQRATFIHARGAADITITGHGHIDGNRAGLDLARYYKGLVQFADCRNVLMDGPVFSDPCNWNTHLRACEDVVVRRLKVLNNRPILVCINTDGVNPDCSRRVTIEHCLMHTGDDAVAVKSCDHGDDLLRDVADITVTDLLAINNSSTAKIGTETCAAVMERICFRRIDAVRTARLCVIDAFDHAHIRDVLFEDCHVAHVDTNRKDGVATDRLIDVQAPATSWRKIAGKSRISNVRLHNISSSEPTCCVVVGRDADHRVTGIELVNVTMAGQPLSPGDVTTNAFADLHTRPEPAPLAPGKEGS
jgi:hypothetical protein